MENLLNGTKFNPIFYYTMENMFNGTKFYPIFY